MEHLYTLTQHINTKLNERNIRYYLGMLNISHVKEISIKGLETYFRLQSFQYNRAARFDYFLPELQTVIEFDGPQHFQQVNYFHDDNIANFKQQRINDCLKMNYCIDNRLHLIRLKTDTTVEDLLETLECLKRQQTHSFIFKGHHTQIEIVNNPEHFDQDQEALFAELYQLRQENAALKKYVQPNNIDSDTSVEAFYKYLTSKHLLDNNVQIPTVMLQLAYETYMRKKRQGNQIVKRAKFTKIIKPFLEQQGYIFDNTTNWLPSITDTDFCFDRFEREFNITKADVANNVTTVYRKKMH